jgi:hypothetical protein
MVFLGSSRPLKKCHLIGRQRLPICPLDGCSCKRHIEGSGRTQSPGTDEVAEASGAEHVDLPAAAQDAVTSGAAIERDVFDPVPAPKTSAVRASNGGEVPQRDRPAESGDHPPDPEQGQEQGQGPADPVAEEPGKDEPGGAVPDAPQLPVPQDEPDPKSPENDGGGPADDVPQNFNR